MIKSTQLKKVGGVSSLKTLTHLSHFDVSGNQFENIVEIIDILPEQSLRSLGLSDNFIGELNETTFERFRSLEKLNLRNISWQIPNSNPFKELTMTSIFRITI